MAVMSAAETSLMLFAPVQAAVALSLCLVHNQAVHESCMQIQGDMD